MKNHDIEPEIANKVVAEPIALISSNEKASIESGCAEVVQPIPRWAQECVNILMARIADLEAHNECLLKKNADLTQQNIKLGERLATPKPPEKCPTCNRRYTLESYAHGECDICGDPFYADDALRSMGFTVEGDE